jgi:hypothetical protein
MRILSFCIILFLVSCAKEGDKDRDIAPPIVSINGSSPVNIFLNSVYTDQGATANDAVDGPVSVTADTSSTNPNADSIGTYTVKYTAKDNAGNKGYGYRTVIVENASSSYAGNYFVTVMSATDTFTYNEIVWIDHNINNRIHFNDFGNFSNNSHISADIINGTMIVPQQYAINIGNDQGGQCDVCNHTFQSTSCTIDPNGFTIIYDDQVTSPGLCSGTVSYTAVFIKQ